MTKRATLFTVQAEAIIVESDVHTAHRFKTNGRINALPTGEGFFIHEERIPINRIRICGRDEYVAIAPELATIIQQELRFQFKNASLWERLKMAWRGEL